MKILTTFKQGLIYFFISMGCMQCSKVNTTITDYQLEINSISPASGNANTAVTIKGKGFSLILSDDSVRFNGKTAVVTESTDSSMLVSAPVGGSTGNITISVGGQQATGPLFTYLGSQVPSPTITGISPVSGQAGIQVTITGTQFVADTSKNSVYFNGVKAAVVSASSTQIVVIAPNSTTGPVGLTVNGNAASGPVFTYVAPVPVITSIVYNGVFAILGQHFGPQPATVTIGGQAAAGFTYSDLGNAQNELLDQNFMPASNLNNPAPVTVTVAGQTSNTFSYLFYPVVTAVSPDTVSDNETVIITGTLFGNQSVTSSVRAFYLDGGGNKIYMSPDPDILSWNTNSIQINMKDYGSYPIGSGAQVFYLEVNVGSKSTRFSVRFHIT